MLRSWRVKVKLLLATVTLAVLLSWLYLFVGSLECEWVLLRWFTAGGGQGWPRPWGGFSVAMRVAAGVSELCVSRNAPEDQGSRAVTLAGCTRSVLGPLGRGSARRPHPVPCPVPVSSADGRFLLPPPCVGEQPGRDAEREALASRVRRVEEENQQLRLQLGQAEGSHGSPQWGASAEGGDPPESSNRTACPKQRTVHKCEVGDGTGAVSRGCWVGGCWHPGWA